MLPRVAYLDLDGTLTRDGSMLHGARGLTLDGARALLRLHEAGVDIVPASGRTVVQTREIARLVGARAFIAELGCVVVRGREERVTYEVGAWDGPHRGLGHEVVAALEERTPLRPYEPWFSMRGHTALLRGPPGQAEAAAEVAARIDADATLHVVDNGEVEEGRHAYHVLPRSVSKASAIRLDLQQRGLAREAAVAFGDSEGDRGMASAVGTMYHLGGADGERIVGVPERFAEGLLRAVELALGR